MVGRLSFAAIAAFWVVMTFLLIRGRQSTSSVPVDTVWQRILTAADNSTLELRHHGSRLGTVRWMPNVIEGSQTNAPGSLGHELAGEGMVNRLGGYKLDVDAAIRGDEPAMRFRLRSQVELDTNRVWREWMLRLERRPQAWTVSLKNGDRTFHLAIDEGRRRNEQDLPLPTGQSAGAVLGQYAGLLPEGLKVKDLSNPQSQTAANAIQWIAQEDTLKMGHSSVQVYKVTARLLNRYEATAYVSRAGEILKVQLPDNLVLMNEALSPLRRE
jgi:hypothetical protein